MKGNQITLGNRGNPVYIDWIGGSENEISQETTADISKSISIY